MLRYIDVSVTTSHRDRVFECQVGAVGAGLEDVDSGHVQVHLQLGVFGHGLGLDAGDEALVFAGAGVDVHGAAQGFDHADGDVDGLVFVLGFVGGSWEQCFGADADDGFLADASLALLGLLGIELDLDTCALEEDITAGPGELAFQEVHRGCADEAGDEAVDRVVVDVQGGVALLDQAV